MGTGNVLSSDESESCLSLLTLLLKEIEKMALSVDYNNLVSPESECVCLSYRMKLWDVSEEMLGVDL